MTITGIISAIIIGLIIGALGRLVVPGKQAIPIWLTIIIGIIAAFIGAAIASAIGYANANGGIPWIEIIIQVIIAAIGVSIAAGAYARRGITR
ncbi:MAG: GlsB/YeaQ/YmgE family stress response membrane protein [Pseudonocardiaceae bacterium]